MKPYQLIAALMHKASLRTLPLAKAIGQPRAQPKLQRYVRGEVPEPARATAELLANYFGIPVDAIYDERVATTVAKQRQLSVVDWPPRSVRTKQAGARQEPLTVEEALEVLARFNKDEIAKILAEGVAKGLSAGDVVRLADGAQATGGQLAQKRKISAASPVAASGSRGPAKAS